MGRGRQPQPHSRILKEAEFYRINRILKRFTGWDLKLRWLSRYRLAGMDVGACKNRSFFVYRELRVSTRLHPATGFLPLRGEDSRFGEDGPRTAAPATQPYLERGRILQDQQDYEEIYRIESRKGFAESLRVYWHGSGRVQEVFLFMVFLGYRALGKALNPRLSYVIPPGSREDQDPLGCDAGLIRFGAGVMGVRWWASPPKESAHLTVATIV
jgi:hypothetical protein